MDASIKGDSNIRTFVRLLQCASKFGDDLHISVGSNTFELSSIDTLELAYCLFKLDRGFFYSFKKRAKQEVVCRILTKSVLAVLGRPSQLSSVQRIDIRIIDPSSDLRPRAVRKGKKGSDFANEEEENQTDEDDARGGIEARLVMRLICNHGVVRKHSLHVGTSVFERARVDPDTTPSGFIISSRVLRDWLEHFALVLPSSPNNQAGGLGHLGWLFAKDHVRIKTWEGAAEKDRESGMSTQIQVDVEEFDDYELLTERVDLTMPMKEFKAMLTLAEQLSIVLNICFSEAGQPLTLTNLEDDLEDLTIFCAIATRECLAFSDLHLPYETVGTTASTRSRAGSKAPGRAEIAQPKSTAVESSTRASGKRREGQRKASKLSLYTKEPEEERMVTVYLTQSGSQLSKAQHHEEPRDVPSIVQPQLPAPVTTVSQSTTNRPRGREPLFFPNSQDQASPEPELQPPTSSQAGIRMTQQELLQYAGLGDVDMNELGEELDMEEEEHVRMSQALKVDQGHTLKNNSTVSHTLQDESIEEDCDLTWDTTIDLGQINMGIHAQADASQAISAGYSHGKSPHNRVDTSDSSSHAGSKTMEKRRPTTQNDQSAYQQRLMPSRNRKSRDSSQDHDDIDWEEDDEALRATQMPAKSEYQRLFD
ncbi:hypothetical protein L204_101299 [Cryptococcus depauperatus]|nr:hypothetical protein L204_03969 [Cryptococcus depauperatus CBS 7855]